MGSAQAGNKGGRPSMGQAAWAAARVPPQLMAWALGFFFALSIMDEAACNDFFFQRLLYILFISGGACKTRHKTWPHIPWLPSSAPASLRTLLGHVIPGDQLQAAFQRTGECSVQRVLKRVQ